MRNLTLFLSLVLGVTQVPEAADFDHIRQAIQLNSWRKIAFLYLTPRLVLDDLGYTSNIYSYDRYRTPDYRADLGGDLTGSVILGNLFIFSLRGIPFYSYYRENKDLEAFNYSLDFNAYSHLGPLDLNYNYAYNSIRQRPTSEFGIPIRMFSESHQVSLEIGNQDNLFIDAWARQEEIRYEDTLYLDEYRPRNTLQRTESRAGAGITKRIFTDTFLHLFFEYYQSVYAFLEKRNGIGRIGGLEIEFPENSSIRGSLLIGMKSFEPANPLYRRLLKPHGTGEISLQFLERFRFLMKYQVDNRYSFWQEDSYYDYRNGEWGLHWYPGRRIRISYSYQSGRLQFRDLETDGLLRRDDIRTHGAALTYRLGSRLGLGLKYTLYQADSDQVEFDRNYHFIGGFITHDF